MCDNDGGEKKKKNKNEKNKNKNKNNKNKNNKNLQISCLGGTYFNMAVYMCAFKLFKAFCLDS